MNEKMGDMLEGAKLISTPDGKRLTSDDPLWKSWNEYRNRRLFNSGQEGSHWEAYYRGWQDMLARAEKGALEAGRTTAEPDVTDWQPQPGTGTFEFGTKMTERDLRMWAVEQCGNAGAAEDILKFIKGSDAAQPEDLISVEIQGGYAETDRATDPVRRWAAGEAITVEMRDGEKIGDALARMGIMDDKGSIKMVDPRDPSRKVCECPACIRRRAQEKEAMERKADPYAELEKVFEEFNKDKPQPPKPIRTEAMREAREVIMDVVRSAAQTYTAVGTEALDRAARRIAEILGR